MRALPGAATAPSDPHPCLCPPFSAGFLPAAPLARCRRAGAAHELARGGALPVFTQTQSNTISADDVWLGVLG